MEQGGKMPGINRQGRHFPHLVRRPAVNQRGLRQKTKNRGRIVGGWPQIRSHHHRNPRPVGAVLRGISGDVVEKTGIRNQSQKTGTKL